MKPPEGTFCLRWINFCASLSLAFFSGFFTARHSNAWGIMLWLQDVEECSRSRFAWRKNNIDYVWPDGQNGCHWAWPVCVDRRGIVLLQQGRRPQARCFAALCVSVYIAGALGLRGGACICQSKEEEEEGEKRPLVHCNFKRQIGAAALKVMPGNFKLDQFMQYSLVQKLNIADMPTSNLLNYWVSVLWQLRRSVTG